MRKPLRTGRLVAVVCALALLAVVAWRTGVVARGDRRPESSPPTAPSPVRLAAAGRTSESAGPGAEPATARGDGPEVVDARGKAVDSASSARDGDSVRVTAPGYVERRVPAAARRVVLAKEGQIRGRVLGPQGEPLAGASLVAFGARSRFPAHSSSDDTGFFALAAGPRDSTWLLVKGIPSLGVGTVTVPATNPEVEVVLGPHLPLVGRVTDAAGVPVPGAEARVEDATWPHLDLSFGDGGVAPLFSDSTAAAADGSFTFLLPRRSLYQLVVKAPGRRWWERTLVLPSRTFDGQVRLDVGDLPPPMRVELPEEESVQPLYFDESGRELLDFYPASVEWASDRVATWTFDLVPPVGTRVRFLTASTTSRAFPLGSTPIVWAPSRWRELRVRLVPRPEASPEERSPIFVLYPIDEDGSTSLREGRHARVGVSITLDRLPEGTTGVLALGDPGHDVQYAPAVPEVVEPLVGLAPGVEEASLEVVRGRRIVGRVESAPGTEMVHGAAWRVSCHVDGLIRARTEEVPWPSHSFFLDVPDRDVRLTLSYAEERVHRDVPRDQPSVVFRLGD